MSAATIEEDWLEIAARASQFGTPFYLFWPAPYERALAGLQDALAARGTLPVRHWYSYKTLPLPNMARVARSHGLGIEVVSKFELAAALRLGVPPSHILVNGVAKHAWLVDEIAGLNVIFDSVTEAQRLAAAARTLRWTAGLRVAVSDQRDPDDARFPAQFGMSPEDLIAAAKFLREHDVAAEILHVHLRSNVPAADLYRGALSEMAAAARVARLAPVAVDLGGGLPEKMVGIEDDEATRCDISEFAGVLADVRAAVPSARAIWLENGRHLLGAAGVLVLTVQDVKRIHGWRFLICDGGRTNQALESDGSRHGIALLDRSRRNARTEPTVICGPTCMAYDWLLRGEFAAEVRSGDRLVYFNAGAYHLSWESRFSHGLCRIVWTDDGRRFSELRAPEQVDERLERTLRPKSPPY